MPSHFNHGPVVLVPVYAPYPQPQGCGCSCRSHARSQSKVYLNPSSDAQYDLDQLVKAFATEFLSALQEPRPTEPTSSKESYGAASKDSDFITVGEKILDNLAKSPESESLKPFLEMGQRFLKSLKVPLASPEASSFDNRQRSASMNPCNKGKGRAKCGTSSSIHQGSQAFAHYQEMLMKTFQDHQDQTAKRPGGEGDEVQRAIQESLKDVANKNGSLIERLEKAQDPVVEKVPEE